MRLRIPVALPDNPRRPHAATAYVLATVGGAVHFQVTQPHSLYGVLQGSPGAVSVNLGTVPLTFLGDQRVPRGHGLVFTFHNHLPDDVENMMLRVVITGSDAAIVSDRTYQWAYATDAYSDSSAINMAVQRAPQPGETFVWGFVGASKK